MDTVGQHRLELPLRLLLLALILAPRHPTDVRRANALMRPTPLPSLSLSPTHRWNGILSIRKLTIQFRAWILNPWFITEK